MTAKTKRTIIESLNAVLTTLVNENVNQWIILSIQMTIMAINSIKTKN